MWPERMSCWMMSEVDYRLVWDDRDLPSWLITVLPAHITWPHAKISTCWNNRQVRSFTADSSTLPNRELMESNKQHMTLWKNYYCYLSVVLLSTLLYKEARRHKRFSLLLKVLYSWLCVFFKQTIIFFKDIRFRISTFP